MLTRCLGCAFTRPSGPKSVFYEQGDRKVEHEERGLAFCFCVVACWIGVTPIHCRLKTNKHSELSGLNL